MLIGKLPITWEGPQTFCCPKQLSSSRGRELVKPEGPSRAAKAGPDRRSRRLTLTKAIDILQRSTTQALELAEAGSDGHLLDLVRLAVAVKFAAVSPRVSSPVVDGTRVLSSREWWVCARDTQLARRFH